jgi:putative endonuclease
MRISLGSKRSKQPSRLGPDAERRVRRHYLLRGYRLLAANEWSGGNELDLVVRRGRRLVFCEVKTKSGPAYGSAWEAVGPEKVRRVKRAAEMWLAARPELAELDVVLEVAAVRGRRIERASFE